MIRSEHDGHPVVWVCEGGSDDAANVLQMCASCHSVITSGSVEDRAPKQLAAMAHQQMHFGVEFYLRATTKTDNGRRRHAYCYETDSYLRLLRLVGAFTALSPTEGSRFDRWFRWMGRLEYQYFRDLGLGINSWDDHMRWQDEFSGRYSRLGWLMASAEGVLDA